MSKNRISDLKRTIQATEKANDQPSFMIVPTLTSRRNSLERERVRERERERES